MATGFSRLAEGPHLIPLCPTSYLPTCTLFHLEASTSQRRSGPSGGEESAIERKRTYRNQWQASQQAQRALASQIQSPVSGWLCVLDPIEIWHVRLERETKKERKRERGEGDLFMQDYGGGREPKRYQMEEGHRITLAKRTLRHHFRCFGMLSHLPLGLRKFMHPRNL